MTNSIDELEKDATAIFLIGTNTTENHPIIGYKIRKNVRENGAKLIVADPRRIELAEIADVYMQFRPGTDVALLNGMMNVIINEGLLDQKFITERTEAFEDMKQIVEKYTPEVVAAITGVPAADIRKAARIYAEAEAGSICYAMGLTQHHTGTDNVKSVCNLAMLTGHLGRPGTGVNPLRGQNNVQGACDMGALPVSYPAYQAVSADANREKFEKAWGVKLSPHNGLTLTAAINKAYQGELKALYVLGENPMISDPDQHHVEEALDNLEFLIVQDIFLSETAQKADLILPGVSWAEKDGTFSNTERRVQRVRQAIIPPANSRQDWQILMDLTNRLGYSMDYGSPQDIFEEIRTVAPSYAGISYARIERTGLHWPCPNEEHPGTPILHIGKFSRGQGLFHPVEFKEPFELPDEEYPLILSTGRSLFHYHTGTMTRRTQALDAHQPTNEVQVNHHTAAALGIQDGEMVRLSTRRGSIELKAKLTDILNEKVVFTFFHFSEAAANILTHAEVLDPVAGIPEYKVCAARLEKIV
ncbi:Formate dehydrogenase, alpha subunit [Syntrophomonas zehnderi OL-4]|nr:Formate dehydrogenase, alpha subunit [Syntrophomonas zehnderi OL-4]